MVEFEGRIFLRKNRKWSEETKILNLKKTYQENEGNKMIIYGFPSVKNKQSKRKKKAFVQKVFADLNNFWSFSSTEPTSVHWKSSQVE